MATKLNSAPLKITSTEMAGCQIHKSAESEEIKEGKTLKTAGIRQMETEKLNRKWFLRCRNQKL
jgi:hypothetical protein